MTFYARVVPHAFASNALGLLTLVLLCASCDVLKTSTPSETLSAEARSPTGNSSESAVSCPDGQHNGGGGECVARFRCSPKFQLLPSGACGQVFPVADPPVYPWHPQFEPLTDGRVFVLGNAHPKQPGPMRALIYDPSNNTWERLPGLKEHREHFGMTRLGEDKIVVAGGEWTEREPIDLTDGHDRPYSDRTDSVRILDLSSRVWIKGPAMPLSMARFSMVTSPDGTAWIGADEVYGDEYYALSPESDTWKTHDKPARTLPPPDTPLEMKTERTPSMASLPLTTFDKPVERYTRDRLRKPRSYGIELPGGPLVAGPPDRSPQFWRVVVDQSSVENLDALSAPAWGQETYAPVPVVHARGVVDYTVKSPRRTVGVEAVAAAYDDGKSVDWILDYVGIDERGRDAETFSYREADFDGDGSDDLALAYLEPSPPKWTGFVIWSSGNYSPLPSTRGRGYTFFEPADLSGDGTPELVFSVEQCGAHTCFHELRVWSSHGDDRVRPVLEGRVDELAQRVDVVERDGWPDYLEVVSGWVGSAGAGNNQRGELRVWKWNPKTQLVEPLPAQFGGLRPDGESVDLMDKMGDAHFALESGDKRTAWKAFERIIRNGDIPAFDHYDGGEKGERLREQLRQVAYFQLARICLEARDQKTLARVRRRLKKDFPDSPTLAAINALEKRFDASGNMSVACMNTREKVFGGDWTLAAHGYNPQFAPYARFGRKYLCAGLDPPPEVSGDVDLDFPARGHVAVSFSVKSRDPNLKIRAEICDGDCESNCRKAGLAYPEDHPFESVSTGKSPLEDVLVWSAGCEESENGPKPHLCIRSEQPDVLMHEMAAPGGECSDLTR